MGKASYERRKWVNGVRRGYKRRKFSFGICLRCQESFKKLAGNQLYCGSFTNKLGCSWEREKERQREIEKKNRKLKLTKWVENRKRCQENWFRKNPNYMKIYGANYRKIHAAPLKG